MSNLTPLQWLGWAMLTLPAVGWLVISVKCWGWRWSLKVLLGMVVFAAFCILAGRLITGEVS